MARLFRRLFRRLFLGQLDQAKLSFHGQLQQYIALARKQDWPVYAKAPLGGPEKMIGYLGRYTHRVAITNYGLVSGKDGRITFRYKDYRSAEPQKQRTMTLNVDEFIRRSAGERGHAKMLDRRQHLASPDHSRLGARRSVPTTQLSDGKLIWATPDEGVESPQWLRGPRLETRPQRQNAARLPFLRPQSKLQSP